MPLFNSPLRYPGGKGILSDFLSEVLCLNGLRDGLYVEPYAGGAGAALNLLYGEHVQRIILNDADPCIYAFWDTILNRTRAFISLLRKTPVTIEEWKHQKFIYNHYKRYSLLRTGFACFYLNRCNRSGIIVNAGPIGGIKQNGKWKIDARFNKDELIRRIKRIAFYRDRIEFHCLDAKEFVKTIVRNSNTLDRILVYFDPPYYSKGSELYLNYYKPEDHEDLAEFLRKEDSFKWLMS